MKDNFLDLSHEQMAKGYISNVTNYECLICGKQFEIGRIFQINNCFYDAEKTTQKHIDEAHNSMFQFLVGLGKEFSDLTDQQKAVLKLFKKGLTDLEIAQQLGTTNTSTVRSYRFAFKKKEKQAKVFLAIMELLKEEAETTPQPISQDEAIIKKLTNKENRIRFPKKQKEKMVVLEYIIKFFVPSRYYSEKEVNEIILNYVDDFVTIRRELVDYGFLTRDPIGENYIIKER